MSTLNHDAAGFLVGPRLTDDLDKISRELKLLRAIRGDTQETVTQLGRIADALNGIESVTPAEPTRPVLGSDAATERLARADVPALPGAANDAAQAPASAPTMSLSVTPADLSGVTVGPSAPAPQVATVSAARPHDEHDRAAAAVPARLPLETRAPAVADPASTRRDREAKERTRDKNGRFGSSDRVESGSDSRDSVSAGESRAAKAMGAAGESIKGAVEGLASGADNIDPAVSAAKELGGIVAPVVNTIKPLGRLFGRGSTPEDKRQRQNVTWYRRIYGELREGNKKSGGGRMGLLLTGLMSMLGMMLAPLRALSKVMGLTRALGALGGLAKGLGGLRGARGGKGGKGGAAGANGRRAAITERGRRTAEANRVRRNPETGRFESQPGAKPGREGRSASSRTAPGVTVDAEGRPTKGKAGTAGARAPRTPKAPKLGLGGSALKLGKGFLRKLPFVGALIGAGMFASAALGKDDPNATDEERQANKKDRWGTMGGVAGGVLGGALGLIGGPMGAMVGGMIGDQLGTAVGEWLSTVDMDAMIANISDTFSGWADSASKMASSAFEYVQGKWDGLVADGAKVLTGMGDWVKEKWGKVAETYNNVKDTVADKVQSGKDYVGQKAATVKDAGQNVLNTVTGGRYTGGSNARKDELIKAMDAGGITDPQSKAGLMANVDHESQGFTRNEENLNYSAKRLQEVFPKYYKDADSARADAGNPEAIANKVYGGRMGNTDPGDGFKFRGRGDIHLTGKDQYAAMGEKLGVDLVNNPELAADPKYSAQIAVQYWKDSGANALAAQGNVAGARKAVNGGTNGLKEVSDKYDQYLPQARAGDLTPVRQANEVRIAAPAAANDAINQTLATMKGRTLPLPGVAGATAAPGMAAGVPSTPTPLQVAGVGKISQAQPIGVLPIPAANVQPVSVGANLGSFAGKTPSMMMSTPPPVAIKPLQVPSYSAPAPDAGQTRITPTPQVAKPMIGPKAASAPAPQIMLPLTQNLADRDIAHAATGGIGMSGSARL